MSPISQKSKRIPKHTPQYMQFVKEATNSKRLAKQRSKMHQKDKATLDKVRQETIPNHRESALDSAYARATDKESQEEDEAENFSKAMEYENNLRNMAKKESKQALKDERWSRNLETDQIKRPTLQASEAKAQHQGRVSEPPLFESLADQNFNESSQQQAPYNQSYKPLRKDSDSYVKGNAGTATKNNGGTYCESVEREKSICSSNKELIFQKKKSTVSSKKSRKELNSHFKMMKQY